MLTRTTHIVNAPEEDIVSQIILPLVLRLVLMQP